MAFVSFVLNRTLDLEQEREYENNFYEHVKETWIKNKTKENLDWVSQRMHRLNRVDQRITLKNQLNLPKHLLDLIEYIEEIDKKWQFTEIQNLKELNDTW